MPKTAICKLFLIALFPFFTSIHSFIQNDDVKVIKEERRLWWAKFNFFQGQKTFLWTTFFFLSKSFPCPLFFASFMRPKILQFLQCHLFFYFLRRTIEQKEWIIFSSVCNALVVIERRALGPFVESYYPLLNLIDMCWQERIESMRNMKESFFIHIYTFYWIRTTNCLFESNHISRLYLLFVWTYAIL